MEHDPKLDNDYDDDKNEKVRRNAAIAIWDQPVALKMLRVYKNLVMHTHTLIRPEFKKASYKN